MKKVLLVGSEVMPFAATGGLGDVLGSLPAALMRTGECEVRVMLPLYRTVGEQWRAGMRREAAFEAPLAWRRQPCTVYSLTREGVVYYFLENAYYFDRDGLYGHYDDGERFAWFCMAALTALPHLRYFPDILHANDWQAALAVVYLNTHFRGRPGYGGIRTVFTIHNIAYQGQFSHSVMGDVFALDAWEHDRMDCDGCINLMKGAIVSADRVTTVSPRYAAEICGWEHSYRLDGVLRENAHKLCGILNGIDYRCYDPAADEGIARRFDAEHPERKAENKIALQRELGLDERADAPLFAVVSRLAAQKGLDLVAQIADELLAAGAQLIVLGCGEPALEDLFRGLEARYRRRVCAYIGYDRALAKRVYAGCDIFLMPSRSEPCGLSQMIASRYGAIPVVRAVGGLADTIFPCREENGKISGNGFVFYEDDARAFAASALAALALWRDPARRRRLVQKIMRVDFSWERSAASYAALYASL